MRLLKPTLFLLFLTIFSSCQKQEKILVSATYEEPADPSPDQNSDWDATAEGLNASFVSTGVRFVKSVKPNIQPKTSWKMEAWKGERVSAQMVAWTKDSLVNVRATVSDFESESGDILGSGIAQARFVKYVITDEFADGCGYRKPEDFAASLAADALDTVSSYTVRSKETRPLWLTFDVPSDAKPGLYKGTVAMEIEGQKKQNFELALKVLDKVLPPPSEWAFHLDLWQNPYAIARYYNVEPWSPEHWELVKPGMKRLADAGQKVITVSLNKRPWGGQTFDQFEGMIEWKKQKDGTWNYDFTHFDNWVQFMMDLGVKNQINCYSMVPWGNEIYYFDEKENKEIKVKAAPGSEEYEALWVPFLKQFKTHLAEKGWYTITRMAMDERGPEEMKAMLGLLEAHAPELGFSLADNHKSYKLYPNQMKDLSVAFGATVDAEDLDLRKERGYISTHYVCCADKFPNVFTFSDPSEGVFIGWYSIAAEFDGFLHWSYNSWVENPLQDSRFRAWPAGDTYLVYPDNRTSIRFETLREGIQDAEKIRVLREDFTKRNLEGELDKLNKIVEAFNITEKPENLEQMLNDAKKELNELASK
ncbi:DUF4091 domain-containing protein [Flagellimonas myxillae]|uniref:DUF4091 domain-containing protein n=1 Tax=Flagellimonas myxillae TaxID=2942214 RepID=UPI00201FB23F|nr:glycoside hydrolase domain-containing protein [Muricauda myxillae]MCL6265457.1 DUF4091 domain-containing protein [Muricauda myxillae]